MRLSLAKLMSPLFRETIEGGSEFIRPAEADFRREATLLIAGLLVVLSLLLMEGLEYVPASSSGAVWLAIFALAAGGFLALGVLRQRPRLAGLSIIGILLAFCLGEATLFASSIPLFALPLVVVAAGASLGWIAGFVTAGLGSIGMLLLVSLHDWPGDSDVILAPLLFVVTAAFLVWLGGRPAQAALVWSWSNYSRMRELTEESQRHQGELAEALKGFSQACYQLECANEELARARAAADEARLQKAQFAANLSHELRTPLNLVIGFSEMILFAPQRVGEPTISDAHREDVDAIYRNAQYLSSLLEDVLDLGEIDAGRMGIHKEWVQFRDIAEESVNVVATLFEDRGLSISIDVSENLPPVYVDRARIRQVFINLLNNAARFTERGGAHIRAHLTERDLIVTVADTGVGIPATELPHIFEEFRQSEPRDRTRFGGRGLGLAICKTFIELHGGNIWVESKVAPEAGRGTAFSFSLPLIHNVASLPLRATWETWAQPPGPLGDEEAPVLVVSADPATARLFQRHLDGFRVASAGQLPAGATTLPVRAIIRVLDQHDDPRSAVDGAALTDARLPVVSCRLPSGRDLREDLRVTDYLVKPFTREQLLAALERIGRRIETVLIVDDDLAMLSLIDRTLSARYPDLGIVKASGGQDALAYLQNPDFRIDLLIMDLLMPPLNGMAVLEAIETIPRLADLPIIIVSARGFIDHRKASSWMMVERRDGLSIGELMACTRAIVQLLSRNPDPTR